MKEREQEQEVFNPLRNEVLILRFINRPGSITEPHHVLFGGMAEGAKKTFTVPILESTGTYVNVLTNNEKKFFEELYDRDMGAYTKNGQNYWDNYQVELTKGDNVLHLADPDDYIKYKVLLANKNLICPSQDAYDEKPLATYLYVITSDQADLKRATKKRNIKVECIKWAGKNADDFATLKTVLELLDGRVVSDDASIEFIQNEIDKKIDEDAAKVYSIISDEQLPVMILLKRSVGNGLVIKNGDFYYYKQDKQKIPMCKEGEDPTIKNAIKFLLNPKNQELKFALEAQLKN